jgi:hypothetical protein
MTGHEPTVDINGAIKMTNSLRKEDGFIRKPRMND